MKRYAYYNFPLFSISLSRSRGCLFLPRRSQPHLGLLGPSIHNLAERCIPALSEAADVVRFIIAGARGGGSFGSVNDNGPLTGRKRALPKIARNEKSSGRFRAEDGGERVELSAVDSMTPSYIPSTVRFDVNDMKYLHSGVGVSVVDTTDPNTGY